MRHITLQHKILFGYVILTAVIVSMVAVLFHERKRVQEIESESNAIGKIQNCVNTAHRQITILATYGESVIVWDEGNYHTYRERRLRTDSLLQQMKEPCGAFIRTEQIDSLRSLLADKEAHLYGIMRVIRRQNMEDSLLLTRLPTEKALTRTVTRKKKGIAGWFGKKDTIHVSQTPESLYSLNKKMIAMQEKRGKVLEACTDSLRSRNRDLNRKLHTLITDLDGQMEAALYNKKRQLEKAYRISTRIVSWLVTVTMALLVLSYLIIHRELKRDAEQKVVMRNIIEKNNELLETRKHIILTISHDIRAPLNIINGSAELAMDTRDKKRRNIYLTNIEHLCRHILHLLNNLLDVYRLNESKETCNNVPFHLKEFLGRVASGFSHVVNDKGILFMNEFKNVDVTLYGDMDRLSQIIDNLLSNALKFTDSGTILFHAGYEDGHLSLKVKDTGIGMSEETLSRIFRPFEKLSAQMNANGFGLGLPITKGLVKLMGGTIEVESEPGKGSTFLVSLPFPVSDKEIEQENRIIENPSNLPRYVLVIDDDTLQLEIAKEMLERNGVMCTTCSNVKDLVKEMRKKDYDLLLTDIQMGNTSGFEILTLLRESNIGNSRLIPVIAMTARGDKEKADFIRSGFSDSIYKPFSMPELLSLISAFARGEGNTHTHDFSVFTEDVSDKQGVLRMFISQTKRDVEELLSAQKTADRTVLQKILHRMSPAWELLQSDGLLSEFRAFLNTGSCERDAIMAHIQRITGHALLLVEEAEHEIKRLADETQDTDS
ncbi:ATP-binding protein [Parabacteroides distasonis]|uniref:ATP-binding response regulator n=1 Tax=Parabacteroides distasonis TaxID=823 RepID=UPI0021645476|nr:ATP-binding protein [Parabacteroides distasonis]UVR25567.1 ATP-binding protein [Parabacteroides distasonis]